jgi:hypothetical protein
MSTTPRGARLRDVARAAVLSVCVAACGKGGGGDPRVVSLEVTPATSRMEVATTQSFRATATYSDGATQDVTAAAMWTSSDAAFVAPGMDCAGGRECQAAPPGVATAMRAGTAVVTAALGGASGSAAVSVAGLHPVAASVLWAPVSAQTYVDQPTVVSDGAGRFLALYGVFGASGTSLSTRSWAGAAPDVWSDALVASDHHATTAVDEEVAVNGSGAAGLVHAVDTQGNVDWTHFGVSYLRDGVWTALGIREGMLLPARDAIVTPAVAMAGDGVFYVAYRGVAYGAGADELNVARFGPAGLLDVASFAEPVGDVYVAVNARGEAMVLNTWTGSRVFDGSGWGTLTPFGRNVDAPALLELADDGTAELVTLFNAIVHYRYAGGAWTAGERLNDASSATWAAGAADRSGRMAVAYVPGTFDSQSVIARIFDGTRWSAPAAIDGADRSRPIGPIQPGRSNLGVATDGSGRFVVLWMSHSTVNAAWFDGSWHPAAPLVDTAGAFRPAIAMTPDARLALVADCAYVYDTLCAATFRLVP